MNKKSGLGLMKLEFDARHPELGLGFTFSTFEKDGLVHVGNR